MNPGPVAKKIAALRAAFSDLTEEELVEFSRECLRTDTTCAIENKLAADLKTFVGILLYTRSEIQSRCLDPAKLLSLMITLNSRQ